jgi:hypothetical protein
MRLTNTFLQHSRRLFFAVYSVFGCCSVLVVRFPFVSVSEIRIHSRVYKRLLTLSSIYTHRFRLSDGDLPKQKHRQQICFSHKILKVSYQMMQRYKVSESYALYIMTTLKASKKSQPKGFTRCRRLSGITFTVYEQRVCRSSGTRAWISSLQTFTGIQNENFNLRISDNNPLKNFAQLKLL